MNKDFDMGDYPDLQGRPQDFISERRRKRVRVRETDVTRRAEVN